MNYNKKLLWCLIFLGLVGCSRLLSSKGKEQQSKEMVISNREQGQRDSDQEIEEQLINAARSIEKSLATLAANQAVNNVPVLNTAPLLTPEGGMGGTADIDWTGPIEPLLQKIAEMTNYTLKVLGNAGSIPIIVSISQSKAIVADILKNASLQAGNRANIVVFPANKIIELRYKFNSYNLSNNSNENS